LILGNLLTALLGLTTVYTKAYQREEMDAWRSKLLRYSRGYNPLEWLQIPFLTKKLEIAETAAQKEAERISKEKAAQKEGSRTNC